MSHRVLLTIDPTGAGAEEFFRRVSPEAITENIASSRFIHYVAEVDGIPIGYVSLRDNSHLFHLFVAVSHHGQGVGCSLWDHVRDHALRSGNPGTFTVNSSPNATAVYETFGFLRAGTRQEMHGIAFIPMRMQATASDA